MDFLDKSCDEIKENYKIEICIQDELYNSINEKKALFFFDNLFTANFEYFNNSTHLISLAHQIVFAMLYRPNNSKFFSHLSCLINSKYNEYYLNIEDNTKNNIFINTLFDTITKYLINIHSFPSISPLIFLLRRLYEKELVQIEKIISFLHSIQYSNNSKEIIFLSFVVFAPEIEQYNIDSYDSFYNIVEELSFAQTSDDEYQVNDEGYNYNPFRSFITHFCTFHNDEEESENEKSDENDKWSLLKKCVEEECDLSFPLLKAIKHDDVDFLQTIISTNADFDINQRVQKSVFEPNPNANRNYYLIEYCCLFGSIKCFKFLLLQHVRLPFMVHIPAIIGGNVEIIHILEQTSSTNNKDTKSNNEFFPESLHYAALYHQNSIFFWLIESKGKHLFEYDFEGKTIIGCAAASNNIEVLIYIIQTGIVKINFPDYNNYIEKTPLIYASENGSYEVCKILLGQKSIQINFENNLSPIHAALLNSHFHIIRLLCERNDIDLNVSDENGSTPLHIAINNNDVETVRMLLSSKNKQNLYQVEINRKNNIFLEIYWVLNYFFYL